MRRCARCAVHVEGNWNDCPLCSTALAGEDVVDPLPAVQLAFSRPRALRVLFVASIAVVVASFGVQLIFLRTFPSVGALRSVWLGVITMWLVVTMALRKRRNVAKATVWLVILIGVICVYWDYLTGWHRWSISYAVPIMCSCAIIGALITVWVMRIEVGDYILYSLATVALGLAPVVFLGLGWVDNPVPSEICGVLSIAALLGLHALSGPDVRSELKKRLRI